MDIVFQSYQRVSDLGDRARLTEILAPEVKIQPSRLLPKTRTWLISSLPWPHLHPHSEEKRRAEVHWLNLVT